MSLGSGSISMGQFFYYDDLPTNVFKFIKHFDEKIRSNMIRPIGDDEATQLSFGWANPFTGSADREEATFEEFAYDTGFVLGLRIDTKKVHATTYKMRVREALAELVDELAGDDKERKIHKKVKDAAKERVKEDLLSLTLPQAKIIEVYIDPNEKKITVCPYSKANMEIVHDTLIKTFEFANLFKVNPGTMLLDDLDTRKKPDEYIEALTQVVPFGIGAEL